MYYAKAGSGVAVYTRASSSPSYGIKCIAGVPKYCRAVPFTALHKEYRWWHGLEETKSFYNYSIIFVK
jgi:hypothetical protein